MTGWQFQKIIDMSRELGLNQIVSNQVYRRVGGGREGWRRRGMGKSRVWRRQGGRKGEGERREEVECHFLKFSGPVQFAVSFDRVGNHGGVQERRCGLSPVEPIEGVRSGHHWAMYTTTSLS